MKLASHRWHNVLQYSCFADQMLEAGNIGKSGGRQEESGWKHQACKSGWPDASSSYYLTDELHPSCCTLTQFLSSFLPPKQRLQSCSRGTNVSWNAAEKQHRVPIQTWWTEFSSDKMLCWHFLEVSYHTNWDHLMQLIIGSSSVLVSVLCSHASHQPLAFLSERKLLTKTELLLIQRVQISHMISTLIQHHTQNKNGQSSKVIWIF